VKKKKQFFFLDENVPSDIEIAISMVILVLGPEKSNQIPIIRFFSYLQFTLPHGVCLNIDYRMAGGTVARQNSSYSIFTLLDHFYFQYLKSHYIYFFTL
jgi:hypothetical protein